MKIAKSVSKVAEIRSLKNPMARFTIADGKELLFMVLNDEEVHPSYDVGVWVNTDFFANALEQMFELAWQKMTPLSKVLLSCVFIPVTCPTLTPINLIGEPLMIPSISLNST